MSPKHARRPQAPVTQRFARLACTALLVAGGLATWWMRKPYRSGEAIASAWAADHLAGQPIWAYPKESLVLVGRPVQLSFVLTPECSSVVVAVIFFLGSAVLAMIAPRFRVRRILTAFAVAVVLAVLVNVGRVMLIILASSRLGETVGFRLSHEYVGSILTVFGMAFALLAYLWLLARDRTPVRTA